MVFWKVFSQRLQKFLVPIEKVLTKQASFQNRRMKLNLHRTICVGWLSEEGRYLGQVVEHRLNPPMVLCVTLQERPV